MKCPKCHFDNPNDTNFCGKCATQLPSSEDIVFSHTQTLRTPIKELTTSSTFAGRYQIIEELGKGGMGRVYKALDTEIKEKIALKLLKPEIGIDEEVIERFRNELKLARKISQKNVCRMYDLNRDEGVYYITMEYIAGEDLKRLIRKVGQMSAGKTISIAKQVCEGLAEAHSLGIVHRDLKPQNIMVDEDGNAKIMDFGIARSISAKGITREGVMIGTPEYMSPEQVDGKEVDQRSDVYSLGVILYEMLTGRVPFEGETALSTALKHKAEEPENPKDFNPQIPESLSRLILKCLEKKPERRYDSVQSIARELDTALGGNLSKRKKAATAIESSAAGYDQRSDKQILDLDHAAIDKNLAKIIAYSQLSTKDDIVRVTFSRTDQIVNVINEIMKNLLWNPDEVLFINQGGGEITLILDREHKALFQNILPQAMEIREKLAVIRIREPKAEDIVHGIDVPGLYAFFINQISKININILDIMSPGSNLMLVIAEQDVMRAYATLSHSIQYFRNKDGKPKT
jgi:serine/threonine protein kinase